MINKDSNLSKNYLEVTKSRVFKILPLLEEKNEGVYHYIDSLIFELYGLQYVVTGMRKSHNYISLLCGLESILDEVFVNEKELTFIRSEIFKLIGLVEKIQKGEWKWVI